MLKPLIFFYLQKRKPGQGNVQGKHPADCSTNTNTNTNTTYHVSPITCFALPTFYAMLVKTVFMLKPLEALPPLELEGTTNRQMTHRY